MGKGKATSAYPHLEKAIFGDQPTLAGLEHSGQNIVVPRPLEQRVRMSCTAIVKDKDWFTLSVGLWVGRDFQHLTDPESPLVVARHGEPMEMVREQAHDVMQTILLSGGILVREDVNSHYETRHLDGDRVQEWRYWVYVGAPHGVFIQEDSSGKAVIRPVI